MLCKTIYEFLNACEIWHYCEQDDGLVVKSMELADLASLSKVKAQWLIIFLAQLGLLAKFEQLVAYYVHLEGIGG